MGYDISVIRCVHQDCPPGFSKAAGGPCAGGKSDCSDFYHNGDIDNDSQLTVFDLDSIAAYIIQVKELSECELYRADGKSGASWPLARLVWSD